MTDRLGFAFLVGVYLLVWSAGAAAQQGWTGEISEIDAFPLSDKGSSVALGDELPAAQRRLVVVLALVGTGRQRHLLSRDLLVRNLR